MLFIKFFTILLLTPFFILAVNKIRLGYLNALYIVYPFFYIFYVIPLILDIAIGVPDQYSYIGFHMFEWSKNDTYTTVIYSFMLIIVTAILFMFGIKNKVPIEALHSDINSFWAKYAQNVFKTVFLILFFYPTYLVLVSFSRYGINPSYLFDYPFLARFYRPSLDFLFYYYMSFISILSFVGFLFLSKRKSIWNLLIFSFPLFISFSINGKRAIVAYLIFLVCFMIYIKKEVSPKKMVVLMGLVAFLGIFLSILYQSIIRKQEFSAMSPSEYMGMRVDFGRDDVLSMAIYSSVYGDSIIPHDGISVIYFARFLYGGLVNMGLVTPYKYSVYATSYLMGYSYPQDLGWGMTTGLWDELVSNFGIIFGTFVFCIYFCFVMRIADRYKNQYFTLLTYMFCILSLALQFSSFAIIVALWGLFFAILTMKKIKI